MLIKTGIPQRGGRAAAFLLLLPVAVCAAFVLFAAGTSLCPIYHYDGLNPHAFFAGRTGAHSYGVLFQPPPWGFSAGWVDGCPFGSGWRISINPSPVWVWEVA
jgi:hypothetical protein